MANPRIGPTIAGLSLCILASIATAAVSYVDVDSDSGVEDSLSWATALLAPVAAAAAWYVDVDNVSGVETDLD